MKAITSIADAYGTRCVDLLQRPDGTFGFNSAETVGYARFGSVAPMQPRRPR